MHAALGRRTGARILAAALLAGALGGCGTAPETSPPELALRPSEKGWRPGPAGTHVWEGRLVKVTVTPRLEHAGWVRIDVENSIGAPCRALAEVEGVQRLGTYRLVGGAGAAPPMDWETRQSLLVAPERRLVLHLDRLRQVEWPAAGEHIPLTLRVTCRAKREVVPVHFVMVERGGTGEE